MDKARFALDSSMDSSPSSLLTRIYSPSLDGDPPFPSPKVPLATRFGGPRPPTTLPNITDSALLPSSLAKSSTVLRSPTTLPSDRQVINLPQRRTHLSNRTDSSRNGYSRPSKILHLHSATVRSPSPVPSPPFTDGFDLLRLLTRWSRSSAH